MSILRKVIETVAHVMPDRERDELMRQHKFLGMPFSRLNGQEKVTGTALFSAEYPIAGLAHAALAYSTIPKGTITSIDTSEAERVPGVLKVLTHRNAPEMKVPRHFSIEGPPSAGTSLVKILNTDKITWNGQPIALVVADTLDRAEHAASLIRATYAPGRAMTSFEESIPHATKPKDVLGDAPEVTKGDPDKVFQAASHRVDLTFTTPPYNHNAIEPHAAIAIWEDDQHLTLYDTSQFTAGTAYGIAEAFSLKPDDVRVVSPFVGGGFGGKGGIWPYSQLAALAAREVKRPVRLALTRAGIFRIVGGRTPSQQRVAVAADDAGKFTAFIHEGVTAQSTENHFPEQLSFPPRHLYAMGSYRIGQVVSELNRVANTFMRAPGESIGTFAVESAIDALSYELRIDPVDLRLRNEPERDPVSNNEFSSRYLREAYLMGAEKFGWSKRPAAVAAQRDGEWMIGQGVATGTYPVYRMITAARVRINADGTALVQTSCQEMGMGTETVQTQHAAERLALPMEKVTFDYGDSTLPMAGVAGGSSQTISVALAVHEASDQVIKELLSLAQKNSDSPLAGAKFQDVHAANEGVFRRDRPEAGETYAAILKRSGKEFVEAELKTGAPLEIMKYSMHSYAAQYCEVRVHRRTGEVRLNRWVGSFDTGRILNPKTAVSQFRGGIVMGIGMALTEETLFDDRTGRIMNATLAEYHVPVQADVPPIDIIYTDVADPHTPLGAHGIGEIGITGCAAAIANAVYHATGKRIKSLPITLDKLL
ncbi:MAG TPA: xanthine dehydrogenase family protein molybdopterin-binding subunit [Bryobacteraceae bacterium]|nr:xanthine dehydrogenase family protein molybdopterin-binding subunit [Bryobacteraceae bacterium]